MRPESSQQAAPRFYDRPVRALLLLLLSFGAAHAGGYGQFGWGTPEKEVRKKLKKHRLRASDSARHVEFEREAIREVLEFEKREAKRAGRKAWRAWRKRKHPKPRLSATRHWVKLFGLPARVELRFVEGRLYGAVVRVLYSEAQKGAAAQMLDLLAEKYGEPTDEAAAPDGSSSRLEFDAGDGTVKVYTKAASPKDRGILRIAYDSGNMGSAVDRYLEGVRGRLFQVQLEKSRRRDAAEEKKREAKKAELLKHL